MGERANLLAFMASHALAGAVCAVVIVIAILVTDIGHLGTLVFGGQQVEWVALVLLLAGLVITFASVAMAVAVFSLAQGPQKILSADDEAELDAEESRTRLVQHRKRP